MIRPVLLTALALSAPLLLTRAAVAQDAAPDRTIRVSGIGTVATQPDLVRITLGASAEDESAIEAMDTVSEAVEAVIATLRDTGIEERDIATATISLNPVYRRDSRSLSSSSGEPGIDGFRASNTLRVRLRDIEAVGRVLDAVTRAGATDIAGIVFDIAEPTPIEDEARRAAFEDARRRASLYAEAAGATLGPAIDIVEGGRGGPRPELAAAAMSDRARAVPIAPGEREISASVSVVFALE